MRWASSVTGGGQLFLPFETKTIVSTHSEGGDVFASVGYTAPDGKISCEWKTDREVSIKAAAGYKIKSISVDGNPVPVENGATETTYTFTNIRVDHTIHADFERIPVSIKWIDSFTGEEVATYGLWSGETSPIPDIPAHRGRAFSSLSGDDWHCVWNDSTVYINYRPYIYTIPSFGSAKFNGFTFGYPEKEAGNDKTSGDEAQ